MPPSDLTEEQELIVSVVRDIAESEFADRAFEWGDETPWGNLQMLADNGFYCMSIPEEYGGGGLSIFEDILIIEQLTPICPDTGWAVMNATIGPRYVAFYGSEAAKERYLPAVSSGESQLAIAISEPQAGSDVGAMRTSLDAVDDGFRVTGEKTWITNFDTSDAVVLWARLPSGNIGSVILDTDADGIEVVGETTNMAGHTQTQFVMEDVHIPHENVLITSRDDWHEQLARLNWDRVAIAMWTNAVARCAIQLARDYAETREQFGRPISSFQGMRWKFADMVTQYEAGRSLVYRAMQNARADNRVPSRLESSLAKFHAAKHTERIVSEALQVFGANGYQQGHPLEYLYRFNRSRRIGHGTDEILKNGIADRVFDDGLIGDAGG